MEESEKDLGKDDFKKLARSTIRRLRSEHFETWYASLGPAAAMRLQEEHERQLAGDKPQKPTGPAADDAAGGSSGSTPSGSSPGNADMYSDTAVRRTKVPEKDLRARAIVQVSRLQRYLQDLPPRQVIPPKSRPAGLKRNASKGDANGELGRLEIALTEGLVEPENTAAVLLQIGRLRDYVDDRPISRKRLRRLIKREVALPWMVRESHMIITSSLLRSGLDMDEDACRQIQHHVEEWLALTDAPDRKSTIMTVVNWLRDRLHLDKFRQGLLGEWAEMELKEDDARLLRGVMAPPNSAVFLELCFHALRQEEYDDALHWVSVLIQRDPDALERIDSTLGLQRGGPTGYDSQATPFDPFLYQTDEGQDMVKSSKTLKLRRGGGGTSSKASITGTSVMTDEKAAAIRRALQASRMVPGPGAYFTETASAGKQILSTRKSAPASTFGTKLPPAYLPADTKAPGPGQYEAPDTVGVEVATSKFASAPASTFQSRTLYGSVYGASVRRHIGMPAPTSYVVDDYSHPRARWRATEEAKRVMPRVKPAIREATLVKQTNPGILAHIDYAVNPTLAASFFQPPQQIAPAPVGARPRPTLPKEAAMMDQDMLMGAYSGYSTNNTIRAGNAEERARILAGAVPPKVPGVAALGGAPIYTRPVSPSKLPPRSPTPGLGGGTVKFADEEGEDGDLMPVMDPTKSPSKRPPTRERHASTLPSGADPKAKPSVEESTKPSSPDGRSTMGSRGGGRKYDFKSSTLDDDGAAPSSSVDEVKLPKSATITGHIPAPRFSSMGVMSRAERWKPASEYDSLFSGPGPKYKLPDLPSGLSYSIAGKPGDKLGVDSAFDGNGGGPGVCRSDSAFGYQVSSLQRRAPTFSFEDRNQSDQYAPALNLKLIAAVDDRHDKQNAQPAGMRKTYSGQEHRVGLPGVGTYDTDVTSIAAVSHKRWSNDVKQSQAALRSRTKRMFA